MALNKPQLKADIKTALDDMAARIADSAQAREDLATFLSNAIDTFVRGGAVQVTTTIGVADAGLQTSTNPGTPTGPPAAPVSLPGTGAVT